MPKIKRGKKKTCFFHLCSYFFILQFCSKTRFCTKLAKISEPNAQLHLPQNCQTSSNIYQILMSSGATMAEIKRSNVGLGIRVGRGELTRLAMAERIYLENKTVLGNYGMHCFFSETSRRMTSLDGVKQALHQIRTKVVLIFQISACSSMPSSQLVILLDCRGFIFLYYRYYY